MTDLTVWRSDLLGDSRRLGPGGSGSRLVSEAIKTFYLSRKGYCLKRYGIGARDYLEWEEYP